jgi:hypothetical protein
MHPDYAEFRALWLQYILTPVRKENRDVREILFETMIVKQRKHQDEAEWIEFLHTLGGYAAYAREVCKDPDQLRILLPNRRLR